MSCSLLSKSLCLSFQLNSFLFWTSCPVFALLNLRGSSGLVGSRPVVGTKAMLAAEDSLDLGQVWDPGNTRLGWAVEVLGLLRDAQRCLVWTIPPRTSEWCQKYVDLQADADLRYTPQHKPLLLQLPNMKTVLLTVSFSSVVFRTVAEICRMLSVFLFPFFFAGTLICLLRWDVEHLWHYQPGMI